MYDLGEQRALIELFLPAQPVLDGSSYFIVPLAKASKQLGAGGAGYVLQKNERLARLKLFGVECRNHCCRGKEGRQGLFRDRDRIDISLREFQDLRSSVYGLQKTLQKMCFTPTPGNRFRNLAQPVAFRLAMAKPLHRASH